MALLNSLSPCQAWALLNNALVFVWLSSSAWGKKKKKHNYVIIHKTSQSPHKQGENTLLQAISRNQNHLNCFLNRETVRLVIYKW